MNKYEYITRCGPKNLLNTIDILLFSLISDTEILYIHDHYKLTLVIKFFLTSRKENKITI